MASKRFEACVTAESSLAPIDPASGRLAQPGQVELLLTRAQLGRLWNLVSPNPAALMFFLRSTCLVASLVLLLWPVDSTAAPTNGAVLEAIKVPAGGVDVPLEGYLPAALFAGQAVRVLASEGPFNMQLLPESAPKTVTNFLRYVTNGAYRDLIVHRSVPGFVVQTGGFYLDGFSPESVATFPAVTNEFSLSNLRGTVAMAKVGGNPNSATSQWFVNLADNTDLDTNNGGFTVFARVMGGGMSNVDRIAALGVYNASSINPAFDELPLKNYSTNSGSISIGNLVTISNVIKLPGGASSDSAAFTVDNVNGKARVRFRGFPSNNVSLQIHALDSSTNPWRVSVPLKPPGRKFAGLLQRSNGTAPLLASLSLTPDGLFSGKLINAAGSASAASSSLKQQFVFTNVNSGVFLRLLGESAVLWYGHSDAAFFALSYANTNPPFTNTLTGSLLPAAYSGAAGDECPLKGKVVNALLTRTNQSPRPVSGFLQFTFDKAGAAKITGILPDNRKVSGASLVVTQPSSGEKLLPTALFVGGDPKQALTGTLRLPAAGGAAFPLAGSLSRVLGTNAPSTLDVQGKVWASAPGTNAMTGDTNTANCLLKISGLPDLTLSWGPDNKPRFNPTNGMTIKFDSRTGVFSGVALQTMPDGKKSKVPYRGVVFSSAIPGTESGLKGAGLAGTTNPLAVKLFRP